MKAILTISFIALFTASISAQETWRIVEDSDLDKLIYFDVYNINDKIYTFSSTISPNEPIPHVKTNLMQLNYNGQIVIDSLFGNSEYTFVGFSNVRSHFANDRFYIPVQHRYPSNPNYEPLGLNVLDTNYNLLHQRILNHASSNISEVMIDFYHESDSVYTTLNQLTVGSGSNISFSGMRLQKLHYNGDTLMQKDINRFPNTPNRILSPYQLHKFDNHYIILATQVNQHGWSDPPSNLHIYKLDSAFNIIDSIKTTNNRYYHNTASAIFPNGDFVISGLYSEDPNIGGHNNDGIYWKKYIRKYDKDFNAIWTRQFGPMSMGGSINKLIITEDGGIAGVGTGGVPYLMDDGDSSSYLTGVAFKFDSGGALLFYKDYYAVLEEVNAVVNTLWDIDELSDGSFVVCGEGKSFWPYYQRGWIMRVGPDGNLEGSGNDLNIVEIDAEGLFLYPNPASDELRINNAENVKHYQIYDMSGAMILEGNNFPIALKPLSQGAYMVRLTLKNSHSTNHKIFVK